MRSPIVTVSLVLSLALVASLAVPAAAVDKCKAKVNKKTGIIEVDVKGVGGALLWGGVRGRRGPSLL